jgi:O-glycosyl hydrolase
VLDLAVADPQGATNNHFFDVTAWHWYSRASQSYYGVRATQEVLRSYGLGDKPVWVNESGLPTWNDPAKPPGGGSRPYFGSGTMTEQASYVLQALAYGLAAGVQRYFVFQAYDDRNSEAFGLLRNDGTPRPAYAAYQVAARYLTGTQSATLAEHGTASVVTAYTSMGSRVVVLWNNSAVPAEVDVVAQAGQAILVRQPTEANPSGMQQVVSAEDGRYTIALSGATNNNGLSENDFIVGGLVSMLVEFGVAGSPR